MDKHYLTPLFSPASIMVFAGPPEQREQQTPLARAFLDGLRGEGSSPGKAFTGPVNHLDIHMSGTLADLAQTRADLAVIARPADQIAAALEVAGRIRCRAALVLRSGLAAPHCAELLAIARRHGLHLLGPNSLGNAWPCATGRSASAWPSSPTAAALACWQPTGPTRSACRWPAWMPARAMRWRRSWHPAPRCNR